VSFRPGGIGVGRFVGAGTAPPVGERPLDELPIALTGVSPKDVRRSPTNLAL
jgi:hypothetical protein